MFLALVYGSQQKAFAEAIGVSGTAVGGWLQGGDIRSSYLASMLELGLNIHWLLDPNDTDPRNMFADNKAGRALREKHFAIKIRVAGQVVTAEQRKHLVDPKSLGKPAHQRPEQKGIKKGGG